MFLENLFSTQYYALSKTFSNNTQYVTTQNILITSKHTSHIILQCVLGQFVDKWLDKDVG